MWTDILTISVIVGFIGLIFRFHQAKISKLEDKKVDKEMCGHLQKVITENLKKGDEKFNKLFDIMRKHGETLARIDERTLSLVKKK